MNKNYDLYIADIEHERMKMEEFMNRKIIYLKDINLNEAEKLKNYVWKGDVLIPEEMIGGDSNGRK